MKDPSGRSPLSQNSDRIKPLHQEAMENKIEDDERTCLKFDGREFARL